MYWTYLTGRHSPLAPRPLVPASRFPLPGQFKRGYPLTVFSLQFVSGSIWYPLSATQRELGAETRLDPGHALRLEANAAHLPASHLAVVASMGVHVLLDRYKLSVRGEEHGGVKALVVAHEAGGEFDVSSFLVLVALNITGTVDRRLVAEQLHLVARVVAVEPDAEARGGVAVATSVEDSHVRDSVVVGDRVDALAVGAVRTCASASGAGGGLADGVVGVARNLWVVGGGECRGDVIFTSVGLSGEVNPGQVEVGCCAVGSGALGRRGCSRRLVFLKPKKKPARDKMEVGVRK